MKRAIVICALLALVTSLAACSKKKPKKDAGVDIEVDAGLVVDAGSAKAPDGGQTGAAAASADAGVAAAVAATGALIVVSGPVERKVAGWKLGLELVPAAPGTPPPVGQGAPSPSAQVFLVINRAAGPAQRVALKTSFAMQGITAVGPIDEGGVGNIVATVVAIPSDATELAFEAEGREVSSMKRAPTLLKLADIVAKPAPGGRALSLPLSFEPKGPVTWAVFVEKAGGDWTQVAKGDDSKAAAEVPNDLLPPGPDVIVRVSATNGFDVVTQQLKAARPVPEAPADAGVVVAPADAG